MTIPEFPEFTTLTLAHKQDIESIISRFEPYADFTFVNLFTWSTNDRTEVSLLNSNLVVRFPDYITDETSYSIIGDSMIDESLEALAEITNTLSLVPETVVQKVTIPPKYVISEDYNGHDYIYDVEKLATLSGAGLKKKRNKANRFATAFGDHAQVETVTELDVATKQELRVAFKEWAEGFHKTPEQSEAERIAVDRLLDNIDSLNVQFTIVRLDGKICAFSVNEVLSNGVAICHYEKALPIHEGLYAFIIRAAAQSLANQGVKTVNWEQDLGLPGLRQAKTSYQPTGFLRKYTFALG